MPQEESELLEFGWLRNPLTALKTPCAEGGGEGPSCFLGFPPYFFPTRLGGWENAGDGVRWWPLAFPIPLQTLTQLLFCPLASREMQSETARGSGVCQGLSQGWKQEQEICALLLGVGKDPGHLTIWSLLTPLLVSATIRGQAAALLPLWQLGCPQQRTPSKGCPGAGVPVLAWPYPPLASARTSGWRRAGARPSGSPERSRRISAPASLRGGRAGRDMGCWALAPQTLPSIAQSKHRMIKVGKALQAHQVQPSPHHHRAC